MLINQNTEHSTSTGMLILLPFYDHIHLPQISNSFSTPGNHRHCPLFYNVVISRILHTWNHKVGNLWDWLPSLSIIHWRFRQAAQCLNSLFISATCSVIWCGLQILHHLPIEGDWTLDCLQFWGY